LTILSSLFAAAMARCRDMWAATASETGGSPTPLIQQIKKKKTIKLKFSHLSKKMHILRLLRWRTFFAICL
jgi:hypothetical protein